MTREARVEDIDIIVKYRLSLLKEVNKNCSEYNWEEYAKVLREFYYSNILSKNILCSTYEVEDRCVGIVVAYFYNTIPLMNNLEGKMATITDMYVVDEFRGRGIGTKLLKSIMENIKGSGYKKVILNATKEGEKLYKKYGFQNTSGDMVYKFI